MELKSLVRLAMMDPGVDAVNIYINEKNGSLTVLKPDTMASLSEIYEKHKYQHLVMTKCMMENLNKKKVLVIHSEED